MQSAAGQEWFSDTEARLALRKVLEGTTTNLLPRERRWVQHVLKACVKLANVAFNGDISGMFKKLFVGEFSILDFLTNYKVFTKKEFETFANLPSRVSEMETATKILLLDVLNSTEVTKKIAQEIQQEIQDHAYKLATIESSFLPEQSSLADIVRALFTSTVYSVHLASYEECRSGQIPIAFVPPQLLHSRLMEIQNALPGHLKLAIPIEDFQKYYRLPLSQCVYDSNGGIVSVSIPLIEKTVDLKIYGFRTLHFAHNEMTCSIEANSAYVIKDVKNNKIFSVTNLDTEDCQPHKTGLCKVPKSAAQDSNSFCISALMSGEDAQTLKDRCGLHCFMDTRPAVTQITDEEFIAVHLNPEQVRVECPEETYHLTSSEIRQGSLRFKIGCDCKILHGNMLMGVSSQKYCDKPEATKIDVLIPIQMTRFQELLGFNGDSSSAEQTVFSSVAAVLNTYFEPVNSPAKYNDPTEMPFRIAAWVWNFFQSLIMWFLYARINAITTNTIAVGQAIPLVSAVPLAPCQLPTEAFLLLWSILIICSLTLLPAMLCSVYKIIKTMYLQHVDLVAQRVTLDDA